MSPLPALPAISAAGAAAGQGGMRAVGTAILGEVLGNLISNRIPQGVAGVAESVSAPPPLGSAGFSPAGKYFLGTEAGVGYEQLLSKELPRRALINYLSQMFGGGPVFEEMPSTGEFLADALARQTFQARDLTEREIAKIRAEKEYDYLARALESQAGVKRQELSSLGDIQRQRVASGYSAAQGLLSDAIKNVLARENLADSTVLKELATPV